MSTNENEVRCQHCGALLAKVGDAGLTIRRGDLQASINGDFRAALVCYRPGCRRLNVVRVPAPAKEAAA